MHLRVEVWCLLEDWSWTSAVNLLIPPPLWLNTLVKSALVSRLCPPHHTFHCVHTFQPDSECNFRALLCSLYHEFTLFFSSSSPVFASPASCLRTCTTCETPHTEMFTSHYASLHTSLELNDLSSPSRLHLPQRATSV